VRILIACEFSGIVRDAFAQAGHDAWSCDLLPTERLGKHIEADVESVLGDGWDTMIAFPPCTHLALSGARWWPSKLAEQRDALDFIRRLMAAPIPRIAIENPIGKINSAIRKPDQIIQPWWFGHGETKATCLWLTNLPPLMASVVDTGRVPRVHYAAPGPNRWRERSRTLPGLALAMSAQWG
jgi:hypothetical protein